MGDACFFIGHRPEKLPWGRDTALPDFRRYYERLAETLEHAVASGYREFYTGMTEGVSLWAGEIVADYKAARPADGVRLLAVRPYEGQARSRDKEGRRLYGEVLRAADAVLTLSLLYQELHDGRQPVYACPLRAADCGIRRRHPRRDRPHREAGRAAGLRGVAGQSPAPGPGAGRPRLPGVRRGRAGSRASGNRLTFLPPEDIVKDAAQADGRPPVSSKPS